MKASNALSLQKCKLIRISIGEATCHPDGRRFETPIRWNNMANFTWFALDNRNVMNQCHLRNHNWSTLPQSCQLWMLHNWRSPCPLAHWWIYWLADPFQWYNTFSHHHWHAPISQLLSQIMSANKNMTWAKSQVDLIQNEWMNCVFTNLP